MEKEEFLKTHTFIKWFVILSYNTHHFIIDNVGIIYLYI